MDQTYAGGTASIGGFGSKDPVVAAMAQMILSGITGGERATDVSMANVASVLPKGHSLQK